MKIGAEKRSTVVVALVLMALAVFLFARMIFGGQGEPTANTAAAKTDVPAITPPPATSARTKGNKRSAAPLPGLDPRLRLNLLAQSEDMKYEGSARNIFDSQSAPEIPQPVASPVKEPPPASQVYTPPPPPPINLKFFGFASAPGEAKKIFLAQGEDVFIASEGDIVNRRYKVVRIGASSVEIEDVLNNSRQTIPLTPQG